jgi:membrane protein
METLRRLLQAADRLQQRHPWLACLVATRKKFGEDQGGNLAALIAYSAFVALFPLLLVLLTVLDIILASHQALRARILNSAFGQFPVIGPQLKTNVHSLHSTGIALAAGLIGAVIGSLGLASATQNALNKVWAVPHVRRPGFPWSTLRSVGLMTVVGPGEIIAVLLSGIAGSHFSGVAARIGAAAVSLVLNVGLFWLAFRLATAAQVPTRDLHLGAVIAATAWQVLQIAGGYFVTHLITKDSALYGVFAIVLGLLAWLYLQAQITLYAMELSVVRAYRLWPRSMAPPPLTPADVRAYRIYAERQLRAPGLDVEVSCADDASGDGGEGDTRL